ncbi:serine threonine- kinase 16-like [Paramuricea clavata]|uniref:non-specific serine/threonine protein kinase n=1 Tax=Paramuricea clavata TaxID=317549 RepID=A0A7D9E0S3_PARCT|nr:serine threonine- kinase 16-like [Paramuricea clavata]
MGNLCASYLFHPSITINRKRYTIVKDIGEGAFSYVQCVRDNKRRLYALKRVRLQLPEQEEAFTREVNAHNSVSHPNVLQLIESEVLRHKGEKEGRMLVPYYKWFRTVFSGRSSIWFFIHPVELWVTLHIQDSYIRLHTV